MTTATAIHDMIEDARALRPTIESYSEEAERIRQLPDGLARVLSQHGYFGMSRPAELGGLGLDLLTAMRIVEEISIADASAGWCTAIGSGSIGDPPLARDVLRSMYKRGTYVAGVGAPSGRAQPVEGGYRITGRWAYASGCRHADWIFFGNLVFEGDSPRMANGMPEFRVAIAPMSDLQIIDTWHVSGLRGTGSHDVDAKDLFVPEERTAAIALGGPAAGDVEYRIPMFTRFGLALAPVALGAARRAIDELIAMAQSKTPLLSGSKLREKPVVQHEVARAEAMARAGAAYLYETTAALQERAARKEEIDMAMRARVRLALTYATESAAQATDIAYRLGGGTSNYETVGRVLMGLDPGTPLI